MVSRLAKVAHLLARSLPEGRVSFIKSPSVKIIVGNLSLFFLLSTFDNQNKWQRHDYLLGLLVASVFMTVCPNFVTHPQPSILKNGDNRLLASFRKEIFICHYQRQLYIRWFKSKLWTPGGIKNNCIQRNNPFVKASLHWDEDNRTDDQGSFKDGFKQPIQGS